MKHINNSFILALLLAAVPMGMHACGGQSKALDAQPAQRVAKVQARYTGSAQTIGGDDATIEKDASGAVRRIEAGPRGSILALDGVRVWMRGGARIELGADESGAPVIEVAAGQVRLRASGAASLVGPQGAGISLSGRDMLVRKSEGRIHTVDTHERLAAATWSMELETQAEPRGIGSLETRALDAAADVELERLELKKLSVRVQTHGALAFTEVEHIFHNPSDQQREGTFRFPAPDGVMVTGLAMEIGGRMMEGEFVERNKARMVYEEIVDEMQDPALLEWQQGGWFKLRVFPIEANADKKVVLRYVTPLQKGIEGYEYRYLASPPEATVVQRFEMHVNGNQVAANDELSRATDMSVTLPENTVPALSAQEMGAHSYRLAMIRPDWGKLSKKANKARGARKLLLVVDSSRSAMEQKELIVDTIEMLLAELGEEDQFSFIAHDIEAWPGTDGFVPAEEQRKEEVLDFYRRLELDGASDLGSALAHAAELAAKEEGAQVVYIGDGTPSWGKVSSKELVAQARELGKVPVHAAIVGRGASTELWEELCGDRGGSIVRAHSKLDARRFASFVGASRSMARIQGLAATMPEGVELFPSTPRTLFEGQELAVVLRSEKGKMPASLSLGGRVGRGEYRQTIDLGEGSAHPFVAQRWARFAIDAMQADSAPREEIVEMSRTFGVMSKHTSLLVLESEEAYEKYDIERKERQKLLAQAQTPQVSGGDLDNLGGPNASLSPNNIQPGDPEVRIPAPADARSVVLVFPFGDTKIAHFDEESGKWIARFLVDPETEDGQYWVRVTIVHADGRVEQMQLPYTVDTKPPQLEMKIIKLRRGRFKIVATQKPGPDSSDGLDASRVEVQLPWGETKRLFQKSDGQFSRIIRSSEALGEELHLRIVATDSALNQGVLEIDVPVHRR